jgi:hypothetical protein
LKGAIAGTRVIELCGAPVRLAPSEVGIATEFLGPPPGTETGWSGSQAVPELFLRPRYPWTKAYIKDDTSSVAAQRTHRPRPYHFVPSDSRCSASRHHCCTRVRGTFAHSHQACALISNTFDRCVYWWLIPRHPSWQARAPPPSAIHICGPSGRECFAAAAVHGCASRIQRLCSFSDGARRRRWCQSR